MIEFVVGFLVGLVAGWYAFKRFTLVGDGLVRLWGVVSSLVSSLWGKIANRG